MPDEACDLIRQAFLLRFQRAAKHGADIVHAVKNRIAMDKHGIRDGLDAAAGLKIQLERPDITGIVFFVVFHQGQQKLLR